MAFHGPMLPFLVGMTLSIAVHGQPQDDGGTTQYEDALAGLPEAARLSDWHDLLGTEPHIAGTAGDHRQIERLADAFREMGLDTEVRWFSALLPQPVSARLELVGAGAHVPGEGRPERRGVVPLPITEQDLLEDPSSVHPGLTYGWNAFSGTGDVTAEVVYANYGTHEDFKRLDELGIDLKGKIIIARYGRNYRGYKVKFAQEAGAAGLLMYLDPADYGYERGDTWPNGGWANSSCIQRGSVLVLPYKGDALTPFVEATEDAERLDPKEVALPWIPVQPIGYAAASRILSRMQGAKVPDETWQGGLRFPYRLEGGPDLKVRLDVEQDRRIRRSANVIATIPGATLPEEFIVVGCHHDAWGFGAADPLAGSIVLMEAARVMAEEAARGNRPDRTILFAAWGAEEFGIIGSCEWVEGHVERLQEQCVAYVNLDMAAMGDHFSASASPVLRSALTRALLPVPQAGSTNGETLADTWAASEGGPSYGDLGGGSDHVGFVCHVGVPAVRLGAGGAPGVAYHSNYDTLAWYRSTVGDDYGSALMVTRACLRVLGMLADAPVPPYDWTTVADELKKHVRARAEQAEAAGMSVDLTGLHDATGELERAAGAMFRSLEHDGGWSPEKRSKIGRGMMAAERTWLDQEGLAGRPWYRNTYISDDPMSGYAASLLPGLQLATYQQDGAAFSRASGVLQERIQRLAGTLENLAGGPRQGD